MRSPVLLHVVLASEGFVALGALRILAASVLLRMASGMARSGEVVHAIVLFGNWTRILVLLCGYLGCRGDTTSR